MVQRALQALALCTMRSLSLPVDKLSSSPAKRMQLRLCVTVLADMAARLLL